MHGIPCIFKRTRFETEFSLERYGVVRVLLDPSILSTWWIADLYVGTLTRVGSRVDRIHLLRGNLLLVRPREQICLVVFFFVFQVANLLRTYVQFKPAAETGSFLCLNKSMEFFSNGRVTGTYKVGSFGWLCAAFRLWHVWYFCPSHVRLFLITGHQCFRFLFFVRRSECKGL